jgi:DNA-binding NarL/FixJ family response regulator
LLGARAFQAAFQRGLELAAEQALAFALDEPSPHSETPTAPTADPLTPREREVAKLISRGLSNKEIANTLVISPRTAEGHVEHVLTKLGFTSRAQVAAWATRYLPEGGEDAAGDGRAGRAR